MPTRCAERSGGPSEPAMEFAVSNSTVLIAVGLERSAIRANDQISLKSRITEVAKQVFKWGDGLAVRLPEELVEKMGLKSGDEIDVVDVAGRTLVIQKEDQRKAALERLASRNWTLPPDYKFDRDEANER